MKPAKVLLVAALMAAAFATTRFWVRPPQQSEEQWAAAGADAPSLRVPIQTGHANASSEKPSAQKRVKTSWALVSHTPAQPKSGEAVVVRAEFTNNIPAGQLQLQFQAVEPGKYIALKDAAFERRWDAVPMQSAGAGVFAAELPGTLQKHRRLIRYRIRSGTDGKLIAPDPSDAQPNFGYFVYDGVPPWKAAINPNASDRKFRAAVSFSSEVLQRVPVYHLIASKSAVETATWSQQDGFDRGRNEYRFTGTFVYDGVVYDHVGFRARGGQWRHAMGKNMWKFNFLPGHRFQARDHYGNPYQAKWDKLNLGACIQQGDYGMRGEHGMFEAVGFRLFNLAGIEASRTHWVHLRIIDAAEENPADQYSGDFWGLYLAVENVDEHFLKEHGLPAGNLYKMEFGAKTAFNGNPAISDQSDVREFMRRTTRGQANEAWAAANIDLPRYYDYRSILECIHHYDIDAGKNYFYYLNPASNRWVVLPWDIDLSWGERMFGAGQEPFYRMGILSRPRFRQQYQERLAEIRDLLFNSDQADKLIDEHAAMIWNGPGRPSLVDADRMKWDYHPVMVSNRVSPGKAGQGLFYFANPNNTFAEMVTYMKSWVAKRGAWVDKRLLADYHPPDPPVLAQVDAVRAGASEVAFKLESASSALSYPCRWRVAEISDPTTPGFNPAKPWKYEIDALWEGNSSSAEAMKVPGNILEPGHTYRVRARWQDTQKGWSRWSAPIQFTVPPP